MVSKFIKRGTNKENGWEHGNLTRKFWKGTREQGPPLGDPHNTHELRNLALNDRAQSR